MLGFGTSSAGRKGVAIPKQLFSRRLFAKSCGGNVQRTRLSPRDVAFNGKKKDEDDTDPITRFFTNIFGQEARDDPEPLGLKRATVEEFPDLWPPTQELGEALPDDPPEVKIFRPYLKQTILEKQPLLLAYDADIDGWSNKAFRTAMDGSYAAVLIGETDSGTRFGAYNPAGWLGYGDFRECISAFLFTWVDGDTSKQAVKLPKIGGASMAVLDQAGMGPQWGPDGLRINLDTKEAISRLGSYYQRWLQCIL